MKKLFVILAVILPTLLFAQQDTAKRSFRVGTPLVYLCNERNDSISLSCFYKCMHNAIICANTNDSIKFSSSHKIGQITLAQSGYYEIMGFTMSIIFPPAIIDTTPKYTTMSTAPGMVSFPPMQSYDADLTTDMVKAIDRCYYRYDLKFTNIKCKLADGTITGLADMTLYITK